MRTKLTLVSIFIVGLFCSCSLLFTIQSTRPFEIINVLPNGYVTDGTEDYTAYIQNALDNYSNVVFPGFPILINDKGLRIKSNSKLEFLLGSKLILKPSKKTSYNILQVRNVSNVRIINPVIVGDRDTHLGREGQWGMGIGIYSSKNITITNPKISDCWGDGIYIGRTSSAFNPCEDIEISGAVINNNRRNGISVITVDGLKLTSVYLGNSNGHPPMAGIDFEPNHPKEVLKDILIKDITTEGNKGEGILFVLNNLYSRNLNQIDIIIEGHVDRFSSYATRVISEPTKSEYRGNVQGSILFNNPTWQIKSKTPLNAKRLKEGRVRMDINNLKIVNSQNRLLKNNESDKLINGYLSKEASLLIKY